MLRETTGAAMEKALSAIGRRQEAIADNIANAETPGYRPRQVSFEGALQAAIRNEKSDVTRRPAGEAIDQVLPRTRRQPVLGGSSVTVDLETEMTSLARAGLHYDALARALGKHLRMIRAAITGGPQS